MSFSFLRKVDLLSGLHDEEIHELAGMAVMRRFPRKGAIILAEDEGSDFFIIRRGQVKVTIVHENGREFILSLLGEGDAFGELSLLDGKPRSASVIAIDATDLITLSRPQFLELIRQKPRIAMALLAKLASRLRNTDFQIGSLALCNVTNRVSRTVLRLALERGVETDEGMLLKRRPTHQQLALMAGTSRESATRVINRLEKDGYIVCKGREILVLKETYDEAAEY